MRTTALLWRCALRKHEQRTDLRLCHASNAPIKLELCVDPKGIGLSAPGATAYSFDEFELIRETADALELELAIVDGHGHALLESKAWQRRASEALRRRGSKSVRPDTPLFFLASKDADARWIYENVALVATAKLSRANREFAALSGKQRRRFKMSLRPIAIGTVSAVLVVNRDVTEVEQLQQDKRRLSDELERSQEYERRRIGREMHDSTLQDLVAIGLNLRRLSRTADPVTNEMLAEVQAILARTQQDLRTMTYLLHPPLLDEGGISVALASLVRGLSNRMDIRIDLKSETFDFRLPVEVEIALYRVAQEALINVHKHASASHAEISLLRVDDEIVLEVQDNGIGVAAFHGTANDFGVGIPGMRTRMSRLGGNLQISRRELGTRVKATVPIQTSGQFSKLD